ncbi:MAG: hypothetical protein CMN30_34355 [Sandaracinus sp.]|nr:hypothetical protein [Sandaracinus sp.]|tara:strand:+ start:266 stop:784 length:519 start_codon:yes stop_codon:yes gene_type:complete
MTPWQRLKNLVVHQILGVADTPHRIAWGVAVGSVIAWTPTLGFQIMLYLAFAALLRANKVSGIPVLFISNPFTAVPLYWLAWKVGDLALHGGESEGGISAVSRMQEAEAEAAETDLLTDIWTADFWEDLGETLLSMGAELWLGGLILGVAMAVPFYFLTLWAVTIYRRARGT